MDNLSFLTSQPLYDKLVTAHEVAIQVFIFNLMHTLTHFLILSFPKLLHYGTLSLQVSGHLRLFHP